MHVRVEDQKRRQLRVCYFTGPADIVSDYATWKHGVSSAASFGGGIFIEQFLQLCHENDADVYLISTATGKNCRTERVILEYRNPNLDNARGLVYHVKMMWYMLKLVSSIIRFRPNVLLITPAQSYWFVFFVLYFSKILIVPFFHCTLWPRAKSFDELTFAQRSTLRLTGQFLKHKCRSVLSISGVIAKQLDELIGTPSPKAIPFRPIYERTLFKDIRPPDWSRLPFRVIFVGRVAVEKGAYTLLDVARLVRKTHGDDIVFDICGTGAALMELERGIEQENLRSVNLHGHCDREKLGSLYSVCHVAMIPTTRDFPEGFNRASIEAIICGRPAIVSSAALEPGINSAAIEVAPGDAQGIANAIISLREDHRYYDQLCANAVRLRESFFDKGAGWEQGLKIILSTAVVR